MLLQQTRATRLPGKVDALILAMKEAIMIAFFLRSDYPDLMQNPSETALPVVGVRTSRLKTAVLITVICVLFIGSLSNFLIYQVIDDDNSPWAKVLFRLDLGHEPSLPNYCSSLLILLAAITTFCCAPLSRHFAPKRAWFILATILVMASIDETVMIHETMNSMGARMGVPEIPYLFTWTLFGALFALTTFVIVFPVLGDLSKRNRTRVIASGIVFLLGALGVENLAAVLFETVGGEEEGVRLLEHWFLQTIEESLEMVGMAIYWFAVFDHLIERQSEFRFQFTSDKKPDAS